MASLYIIYPNIFIDFPIFHYLCQVHAFNDEFEDLIPLSYLFTLIGFVQMADWAMKKHKGYKKTYDKEYTKLRRKAIIPFIY